MIRKIIFLLFASAIMTNCYSQTILFDDGWRFHRGGMQNAEASDFDDSSWRAVDLPHDWSIEDLTGTNSPFDHFAVSQVSGGYTVGGTGWYRKSFTLNAEQRNKQILIQFDGAYMNTELWLNGVRLGSNPYGYTSFWFNLTPHVKTGNNVFAVQVKNEGKNSRWYSGSGIYRHVWLKLLDPVHTSQWGIYITTPEVNKASARVNIRTKIRNEGKEQTQVRLLTSILNRNGIEVSRSETAGTLKPDAEFEFTQDAVVPKPELWSTDSPVLYTAKTEIFNGDKTAERTETKFGIRTIEFNTNQGFLLNGIPLKMKGGCVHHDNGPLGARAYDRAEERRVELLKASGFNAIRCSHNPPSPAFLDACDRLGMLVINEAFDMWRIGNNPYDYHLYFDDFWKKDIESFIRRDMNHPSIIMWSIGNEIRDMEKPEVIAVGKMLASMVRNLDPTRPVTAAVNNLRPEKDPFFSNLDICGYNYAASGDHGVEDLYVRDHNRVPGRIMFGSESYPLAAFDAWMPVLDNPFVLGDFVWTAIDYIGEASIGWRGYWQEDFFPWNLAFCGDIDICGWKRPQSYYRDALWMENQLSVFVTPPEPSFPLNPKKQNWSKWNWHDVKADWNWPGMEGKPMKVTVYSSCTQVELFLNGKSLGKKETGRETRYNAVWDVPFNEGELKAIGYSVKRKVATSVLQTAGTVSSIKMSPDRISLTANNQDLSYVTVDLTDAKGVMHPKADNPVKFNIEGEGTIVAVGNANPMSLESYQLPQRKAWNGKCLVIVKSTGKPGKVTLTALVDGLPDGKVEINTR